MLFLPIICEDLPLSSIVHSPQGIKFTTFDPSWLWAHSESWILQCCREFYFKIHLLCPRNLPESIYFLWFHFFLRNPLFNIERVHSSLMSILPHFLLQQCAVFEQHDPFGPGYDSLCINNPTSNSKRSAYFYWDYPEKVFGCCVSCFRLLLSPSPHYNGRQLLQDHS